MKSRINPNIFFDFEKKNDLFSKSKNNIHFWDLIRFDVYYHLLWQNNHKKSEKTSGSNKLIIIFNLIYYFFKSFFFKKWDYLFFTASRNKFNETNFFDQNLADIINKFPKKAILFENFNKNKRNWYYKNTVYNPIYIFRKLTHVFFKLEDYSEVVSIIKSEFVESKINNIIINDIIINFKIDVIFYSIIFKFKKPKLIFLTQNGIQKGLFYAAKKYKIPVIEVQHGIIDKGHLAYNYSKNINYKPSMIYLPNYFFAFSNFWFKELNFPVNKILDIGNSFFYKTQKDKLILNKIKPENLVVASSDVFGENLKDLVIDLAKNLTPVLIYFKLHPNQYTEERYYLNEFKDYKNIKIITNEKNFIELLAFCKSVLLIQSTALYEALHHKKTAIIYKRQSYIRHDHVFDNINVHLVDNVEELIKAINKPYIDTSSNKNTFFNDFNTELFNNFMSTFEQIEYTK